MNKKQKKLLWISLVLGVVLCLLLAFLLCIKQMKKKEQPTSDYTWEDFNSMSNEEKDAFYERFETEEDFEKWKDSVQPTETEYIFQWNEPGKAPNEYTWEEYQTLTPEKQEAFYQWFESVTDFEAWMESAKIPEDTTPVWDKSGKTPSEYTLEEYQSLSPEEQDAFYQWFASEDEFMSWLNDAMPEPEEEEEPDWEKTPQDYTWEEYQSLTPQEQEVFYHWFGSVEEFEAWMTEVKPVETMPESWDKPGKNPDEYTWDEYQALTPEEQDLFYLWFATLDDFEAWMTEAQSESNIIEE